MICPTIDLINFLIQPVHCHVDSELVPTHLSLHQVTKVAGLIKDDSPQSPGIFHGHLQDQICLFLPHIAMDDAVLEGSTLVWVQLVMRQLASGHPTQSVDEVPAIQVVEPILVWIVGVGLTIKVMSGRVLHPILITSILEDVRTHVTMEKGNLHSTPPCCT